MTPWDDPRSEADGILDDETYDWLGVFEAMRRSGGRPLVVPEQAIAEAHDLARRTGIPVSATGSAGLAGLLTDAGRPEPGERVVVVFSGVER
jgi:threonine dehydratase